MADTPTWTVTIEATPERVWPWVADLGKHAEWSPKPYRVEWLTGEPGAVGSTFRSVGWLPQDKEHAMEGRVVVSEPNRVFEVVSHDAKQEWTNRFELTPQGSRTVVTKTMTGPPLSGARKAMFAVVLALFVRGAVQKGMNMLKSKVESSS
ncbi:MAG: SRPBCC family protein [Actinobacteria bacterium]|nr:SRPBCC family protein [Actinomycetota bacterium]